MRMYRSRAVASALLGATAVLAACGGGGSGGGSGGGGGRAAPTSTTSPDSGATTTAPPVRGGRLDGTAWVADARDILAANFANVGGPEGFSCTGPMTLRFTDGRVSFGGEVTCRDDDSGLDGGGSLRNEGSYTVSGSELTLAGMQTSGTITVMGAAMPAPQVLTDTVARYRISGDTLSITFDAPGLGTITQRYERSA